ncbi:MAG: lipid-A-disaccharide synthase [Acidobacteriota bacterium]
MEDRPLLMVAGEASADLHGARLLTELKKILPSQQAFGLGGEELRKAGLEVVSDEDIAVVGIVEVLRVLGRARRVRDRLLEEARQRRPAAAVLIDMPEFNLRIAEHLRELGIPVVYYVSPQIWAWRRGRVKKIERVVDHMLVFFPFEVDFYRGHGVEVTHVGHPLVDEVPEIPQVWDHGVAPTPEEAFQVALLPGSRRAEIARMLPILLAAVGELRQRLPTGSSVRAVLVRAATIPEEELAAALDALPEDVPRPEIISTDRFQTLASSHVALCKSGTSNLEVGLLRTPLVVGYRLAAWTYWLAKWLVKVPYVSLVNLVLEREAAKELIQGDMTPGRLAEEARRLLTDSSYRDSQRQALAELRPRLGERGASRRAAQAVAAVLRPESPEKVPG